MPAPLYPYAAPTPVAPARQLSQINPISVLPDVQLKAPVKSLQLLHRYSEQQRMYLYSMLLLTSETATSRAALYWVDMHPQPNIPRGPYTRPGVCIVRRHMDPYLLAERLIHKRTEWPAVKGKTITVGDFVDLLVRHKMNEFVFDAGVDEVALALSWYKKVIGLFKREGLVEVKDEDLDEWNPCPTRRWW
ncbi:hypothetical protein AURDEDRAFT_115470 [Auricularia subglabra TFB-10046 SS5]|uniref:Uncharacterized protein n=1 Tax=Auricularia subglabra (strain TFB-10046 / SS5) TaxID=717982 RepID=J0LK77_AURST|nr:hypothetical protein AURDEDRAFT_115470 [Auricularia subglabra TFB-10046 SS5]